MAPSLIHPLPHHLSDALENRLRQLALLTTDEVVRTVLPHLLNQQVDEKVHPTYSTKDLARKYGVQRQTVLRWRKWGWLPRPLPMPGRCRKYVWGRAEVDEHIARLRASGGLQGLPPHRGGPGAGQGPPDAS